MVLLPSIGWPPWGGAAGISLGPHGDPLSGEELDTQGETWAPGLHVLCTRPSITRLQLIAFVDPLPSFTLRETFVMKVMLLVVNKIRECVWQVLLPGP